MVAANHHMHGTNAESHSIEGRFPPSTLKSLLRCSRINPGAFVTYVPI